MTTALTAAGPTMPVVSTPERPRDTDLFFGDLSGMARALVASGFLPRGINTPEKAIALILTGREMGLGPMASIRSISIIDGKPVVAADRQLAMFKSAGGRARFVQLDETGAVLALRHPNGDEHTETYTVEMARAAGLLSKDNWKHHPKAMLRSRVITAGLKSIGFEATAGVYDPDEASAWEPAIIPPSADGDGVSTAPEDVAKDQAAGQDRGRELAEPITRDSLFPAGKMKGTALRDLPDEFLVWATSEPRKLGPRTEDLVAAMLAELNARDEFEAEVGA